MISKKNMRILESTNAKILTFLKIQSLRFLKSAHGKHDESLRFLKSESLRFLKSAHGNMMNPYVFLRVNPYVFLTFLHVFERKQKSKKKQKKGKKCKKNLVLASASRYKSGTWKLGTITGLEPE